MSYEPELCEPDWLDTPCPGGLSWDRCQADDCGVDELGLGCVRSPRVAQAPPGMLRDAGNYLPSLRRPAEPPNPQRRDSPTSIGENGLRLGSLITEPGRQTPSHAHGATTRRDNVSGCQRPGSQFSEPGPLRLPPGDGSPAPTASDIRQEGRRLGSEIS